MAYFYGSAEHSVDNKNRLTVPAQFRTGLGERFFLCNAVSGINSLWLLPEEEYFSLLDRMREMIPQGHTKGQKFMRRLTESTVMRELDKQNRIAIPPQHLEHIGVDPSKDDKVKIFGSNEKIEIWSLDRWNEEMNEDFTDLASEIINEFMI